MNWVHRPEEPHRGTTRLFRTYALLSLLPLVLLGAILANTIRGQIRHRALGGATTSAQVVSRLGILPLLTPSGVEQGPPPAGLRRLDRALKSGLIGHEVAAVRIWSGGERIVYASQPGLIGRTFKGNEELEQA